MPDLSDLFALSVIKGFNSVFSTDDYLLHIFQSDNPALERCPSIPGISYVITDHETAGALCLKHLCALGHTRVAFVTVSSTATFTIRHRLSGVQNSARDLGIPDSYHVIEEIDMKRSYAHYKDLFLHLILDERVTAFVALESGTCIYLYELFQYLKIDVPSRVSLMTFDRPVTRLHGPNFFTHIDQSEFTIGKTAGTFLRNQIEHRDGVHQKVIAPKLSIHQSTNRAVY